MADIFLIPVRKIHTLCGAPIHFYDYTNKAAADGNVIRNFKERLPEKTSSSLIAKIALFAFHLFLVIPATLIGAGIKALSLRQTIVRENYEQLWHNLHPAPITLEEANRKLHAKNDLLSKIPSAVALDHLIPNMTLEEMAQASIANKSFLERLKMKNPKKVQEYASRFKGFPADGIESFADLLSAYRNFCKTQLGSDNPDIIRVVGGSENYLKLPVIEANLPNNVLPEVFIEQMSQVGVQNLGDAFPDQPDIFRVRGVYNFEFIVVKYTLFIPKEAQLQGNQLVDTIWKDYLYLNPSLVRRDARARLINRAAHLNFPHFLHTTFPPCFYNDDKEEIQTFLQKKVAGFFKEKFKKPHYIYGDGQRYEHPSANTYRDVPLALGHKSLEEMRAHLKLVPDYFQDEYGTAYINPEKPQGVPKLYEVV